MVKDIHKTAIIDSSVKIAENVKIGPYCVITGNVSIGEGTILKSNVIISGEHGRVEIGKNNQIYPFATIGSEPQDDKFYNDESNVKIGDNNIIREYVSINGGSDVGNTIAGTKNLTYIGNNCWLYISSHIAHDVYVEDRCTITNYAGIAGHSKIGHDTIIGGLSGIHQFVNIGHNVMIGGACGVGQDIPPYAIVMKVPEKVYGPNIVGMKRKNISIKDIKAVDLFYKDYTDGSQKLKDVIEKYANSNNEYVKDIVAFLKRESKRGFNR